MPHPKINLSYVSPDAQMIDPRTGKLTRDGQLLVKALNGQLDRLGGVTGLAIPTRNFTVATLPDAASYAYGLIYVSDESGGATLAFSDGTNWRRVQDRAVVS